MSAYRPLEPGGMLDRKVSRLRVLKDTAHIAPCSTPRQ
jgi:hypothetical protein